MANKHIELSFGAPSITGKDCNNLVAKSFTAKDFPLSVKVTNRVGFNLYFPEHGLALKPCHDAVNGNAVIKVDSLDSLQRLASSVEAIAELNKKAELVTIEADLVIKEKAQPTEKTGDIEEPKTGKPKGG